MARATSLYLSRMIVGTARRDTILVDDAFLRVARPFRIALAGPKMCSALSTSAVSMFGLRSSWGFLIPVFSVSTLGQIKVSCRFRFVRGLGFDFDPASCRYSFITFVGRRVVSSRGLFALCTYKNPDENGGQ